MSTPSSTELDKECKKIINTKDYYEALNLEKSATQDEIRRAYKKVIYNNF